MKPVLGASSSGPIRFDDPAVALERACQDERANWIAGRIGLPTTGSKLVNKHGIEWIVQNHATVSTANTLQRWRRGEVVPELDMYPVIAPQNFSAKLTEFFRAIDRCTTKTFAILDTMPGRRQDGHAPGGNSIDTVCHPVTNLVFLDAARVHETVIAHEFGHAWVQYVDECEDHRAVEDASDPQRIHLVNFVQSFVLDLKVNDLIRRKGFDMGPIEADQARSLSQLATSLRSGYRPATPNEEVFMGLLVADEILQHEKGQSNELARFDKSLAAIRRELAPMADLAENLAGSVRNHGYDSHAAIIRCIDECLLASFAHCGSKFDLDREMVALEQEEPDLDKTPNWLPILPPKVKCQVGRHMAQNEISSDWPQSVEVTVTARAKVVSWSPDRDQRKELLLWHRIGPPTRYSDLPESTAEQLAMKHRNQTGSYQLHGGPPHPSNPPFDYDPRSDAEKSRSPVVLRPGSIPGQFRRVPGPNFGPWRNYMAGLGRFLTAVRLAEQLAGEHPYAYAFNNPVTYTDPSGNAPAATIAFGPKWRWDGPWVSGNQGTLHDCIAQGLSTPSCQGFTPAQQAKLSHMIRCIIGCETDNLDGHDPMLTDHLRRPRTAKQIKYWNVGPSRINGDCQNNQFSFPYQDWTTDLCDNIADGVALLCYAVGRNGFRLPGYWSQDADCYSRCMKQPPFYG